MEDMEAMADVVSVATVAMEVMVDTDAKQRPTHARKCVS